MILYSFFLLKYVILYFIFLGETKPFQIEGRL